MYYPIQRYYGTVNEGGGEMIDSRRVVDYSVASGVVGILVCVLGFMGSNIISNLGDLRKEVHANDKEIAILQARMEIIHGHGTE